MNYVEKTAELAPAGRVQLGWSLWRDIEAQIISTVYNELTVMSQIRTWLYR